MADCCVRVRNWNERQYLKDLLHNDSFRGEGLDLGGWMILREVGTGVRLSYVNNLGRNYVAERVANG